MDFSKTLIRCSSIGAIMTEPQAKDAKERGDLSATCKTHLLSIYAEAKYGRKKDIVTRYMDKGNMVEEESITLLSRFDKKFYKKNDERLENEWLSGHPDIYEGEDILNAVVLLDTKSSWDLFTFLANLTTPLNKDYVYQMQGYLALAKTAQFGYISYCLVNSPESIITDERYRLLRRMNVATEENSEYKIAASELEYNMLFDDIPFEERVLKFRVDRDEAMIEKIYRKVEKCREYLAEIEKTHLSFQK